MKKAFSMVELIFIIVLMGILSKVGSVFIPDNKLLNDTNYMSMKIKEAQKNAIGYDHFNWGMKTLWDLNRSDYSRACITCDKAFFESLDHNLTLNVTRLDGSVMSFCFDAMGRPYIQGKLLDQSIDINVTYKNAVATISIKPVSGYVQIK